MKPPTGPAVAAPIYHNPGWTTGAAPAQWVGTKTGVPGTYIFELRFRVPNCVIRPLGINVSGIFSADNGGVVTVDGPPVVGTAPPVWAFQNTFPFNKSVSTVPGLHTIRVTVNNQSGPVGAVVKGTIAIRCPRNLVHPDRPDDTNPARGEAEATPLPEEPGTA
ncbi:MAG TPA: hypothetical protein VEA61_02400 [Allosphingosinicella sp.]|nr:hypothetical protein [Allosphingosinicella sp.]